MTNYLDKEGLKKFWDITKGKYSTIGHNHDDRYLKIGATAANSDKLGGRNISQVMETMTRRDFIYGTLVKTSIPFVSSKPFLLEVKGNGYYNGIVNFMVQGYIYRDREDSPLYIVNPKAICYVPGCVDKVKIVSINGYLCFWWGRQGYWQGFNITCKLVSGTSCDNKVTSVTDTAEPNADFNLYVTPINVISSKGGTIDGNLGIGTAADSTYKLKVNGSVQCVGNLLVNSNTECQGNLAVKNIFHSVGASTLDSTLTVGGAATLNSSLTVKGATTVQGLTANGATSVQDLTVNGIATVQKNITTASDRMTFGVNGNTEIGNNPGFTFGGWVISTQQVRAKQFVAMDGTTNIFSAFTSGIRLSQDTTLSKNLKVTGNVGIGIDADAAYKLKVQGKAYFSASALVGGDLQVNGEIHNGNFKTDMDGWAFTPHIEISEYNGLIINDSDNVQYTFDVEKAKELGLLV